MLKTRLIVLIYSILCSIDTNKNLIIEEGKMFMKTKTNICTDFGTLKINYKKTIYLYLIMRYYYDSYKS